MTDPTPAPALAAASSVTRPTKEGQWTLFLVLLVVCVFTLVTIFAIGFLKWPDIVAADRIKSLAWIAYLSVGAVLLLVCAFMSPYVGTVKASGMGANLEIDGKPSVEVRSDG